MANFVPFQGELDQDTQNRFTPFSGPLDAQPTSATQRSPTITELAKRQLGRFARMGISGATGTGTMLLDASDAIAKLTGLTPKNLPTPSARFQQSLTELGLPEDTTPEEKVTGFLGSVVAGGFDPASKLLQMGTAARFAVPKGFQTEAEQVRQVAKELHKQGIKLSPSQIKAGRTARAAESLAGSGQLNQALQAENAEQLTKLAKRANQIPQSSPLSLDILKTQADKLIEEGYQPISNLPRVGVDNSYRTELAGIVRDLADNRSFPQASRDVVYQEVLKYGKAGNRLIRSFTGKDAIKEIKNLRAEADDLYHSPGGDKVLATAKKAIAKAIEKQIERDLQGRGQPGAEMLQNFRETRTQLAKNYATRDILADPVSGLIDPAKANSMLQAGRPLTGELQTIAKAGSPAFRSATRIPTHGDPGTFSQRDLTLFGGGAGAAAAGSPAVGTIFGSIPIISAATRKGLQSNLGQNMLFRAPYLPDAVRQRTLIEGANQLSPYTQLFDPYTQP